MSNSPDAKLLGKLLDEHGPALALYAGQWTNDPDSCVQEALIEFARQPLTPDSSVAWLYQVVKRLAFNAARGERRRRDREAEAFRRQQSTLASQAGPHDTFTLTESLEQLDDPLREAVVLRLWGGLTFAETAKTMGISTASAQRHYQKAITQLREIWSEPCRTDQDPSN